MTCDRWQVTGDMWHVTRDTWHVTRDTKHVIGGGRWTFRVYWAKKSYIDPEPEPSSEIPFPSKPEPGSAQRAQARAEPGSDFEFVAKSGHPSSSPSPSRAMLRFLVCYQSKPTQPSLNFLTQDIFRLGQVATLLLHLKKGKKVLKNGWFIYNYQDCWWD